MSKIVKNKDELCSLQIKSDSEDVFVASVNDETRITRGNNVGRELASRQKEDRKLIGLVKARPLLYTRNNLPIASYYSQVKRLWLQVANAMGWKVADVRRKWSHIRNSYSRHLRNEMYGMCTGRGRVVSKWYLADALSFLRKHMATDTRQQPYTEKYNPAKLELERISFEEEDVKPIIQDSFPLPVSPSSHHANDIDDSNSHGFAPDENSSYFKFFRGIFCDYQELPAVKQRLFQRQCLSLLHNLLDEHDTLVPLEQSDPINLSNSEVIEEEEIISDDF